MNCFSSAAFDVCFGTITYVNVQIGYASGCRFDGSTIEIPPLLGATLRIVLPAALIPFRPGSWNFPARFLIAANLKWFASANATSTYVIPPLVWLSAADTPELPRAPTPVGQSTATPFPARAFHWRLTLLRYSVRLYVVPLLSERWMTVIARSGRLLPLFCRLIAGSFQRLTVPRKMFARVFASSRRWFG